MKRKTKILLISYASAAVVALAVALVACRAGAASYETRLDANYRHAFSEVLTAVQEHRKINVCLFNNASFGCINNLQVGHGNDSLCTELRYRGEDGKHSGSFMPVDFARIAEGYGCKAYTIHTLEQLRQAIVEAKTIPDVPVLFDIRVLPKSMTGGVWVIRRFRKTPGIWPPMRIIWRM